ncbi:MAG: hypothetical protein ACYDBV_12450 [Nitrospiria bacterium]
MKNHYGKQKDKKAAEEKSKCHSSFVTVTVLLEKNKEGKDIWKRHVVCDKCKAECEMYLVQSKDED